MYAATHRVLRGFGMAPLELKCPDTPMAEHFRREHRLAERVLNGVGAVAAPPQSTSQ